MSFAKAKSRPQTRSGAMSTATATGTISADEVCEAGAFKRRFGIGTHAFTSMRRRGLRTIRIGAKVFVRGSDFIRFLDTEGCTDNA